MKLQEDKHHNEHESQVSNLIYMKLQPYAQMVVDLCASKKLSFKYFGSYEILDRIGGSQIHPVLHVYQLKKNQFLQLRFMTRILPFHH
jgi:hypothetical protein